MGKIRKLLGNLGEVVNSDDPAKTAANIVGSAAQIAHPIAGSILRPHIEKAVETGVNKGIEFASNPDNQAKAKEMGGKVLDAGKNMAGKAASRMGEFFAGRKPAQTTASWENVSWNDLGSTQAAPQSSLPTSSDTFKDEW